MKTIFLTSFNPFVTRNILQTDALKHLLTGGNRVIIFCPDYKKDYFEENFSSENIIIEPVKAQQVSRQDVIFNYLGRSLIPTSTLSLHRREIFLRNKNLATFLLSYLLSWLGYFPLVKKLVRWLDLRTISKNRFLSYFEKYRPNLVFAPDVFHIDDVHFLAEARSHKIKTVGMVRSWDNITNKGLFRIKPDVLMVNNEIVRQEALKYEDMREKNIVMVGLPQADFYFNQEPAPREEFFRSVNLDPVKRTILFLPAGSRFYDADWRIAALLERAIKGGRIKNAQVIMRFRPNDDVPMGDFRPGENFYIDIPGKQFQKGIFRDKELTKEEMPHLLNELYHSDVLCGDISTLLIEGAIFDKPIVTASFDMTPHPYLKSLRRFLDFAHVRKFLKTGCCKIARSSEEFIEYIAGYLNDPSGEREGRKKLVSEQVWNLKGDSGKIIADFLENRLL